MNLFRDLFKSVFRKKKAEAIKSAKSEIIKLKETGSSKKDIKKRKRIGLTRGSGWTEHKLAKIHFGTFAPLKRFRVNGHLLIMRGKA